MPGLTDKYGLPEARVMCPPAPPGHLKAAVAVEIIGEEPEFNPNARGKTVSILRITRADGTAVMAVCRHGLEEARRIYLGKLVLARDENPAGGSPPSSAKKEPRHRQGFWK